MRAPAAAPVSRSRSTLGVAVVGLGRLGNACAHAVLEEEGHGIVLERWGEAAGVEHQRLLLEGRFDPVAMAAQVMLAAVRALPVLPPGAHALSDLPASLLFGAGSAAAREARP